ncbi:MAG: dTDP-4-dehydrorhamnose reductase, partial [Actinomycetota bacterium]|nr:dTDP-4-dehydrorhamnose reductase [Actinomycetota bacterium]
MVLAPPPGPPELWAGIESTRNRVGDRVVDQLERTGHARRVSDLDLLAGLGVAAVRYPVLWDRTVTRVSEAPDWGWADVRLGRLRELAIRPVVGLLHHGNGPSGTGLLDPRFPERFAVYAGAFAERYPWVEDYVPINEPLTTARFSGLYGIWFPHRRDPSSFTRMLVNQVRATVLAMRAIRRVNPAARLIQNEDIGTTVSTLPLRNRARFENERRWLTFDLLCGRVDPESTLWPTLADWIPVQELQDLVDDPCPPDVLGVDHYLTSDRLLDHWVDRYPEWSHSDHDGDWHADVEAVRATAQAPPGIVGALDAAWERYGRPLAIAETHLGCTREEQLRWLQESWEAAALLQRRGADVQAVCVWMVFGGYDWNSLVTSETEFYESGAFDVRGPAPRPTAIARWIGEVSREGESRDP